MELKEGMYVRTLNEIVQIDKIFDGVMQDTKGHLHYGDFIKASNNIIDLIEVGDYVNGAKVDNIILKDDKEICFRYIYAFEKEDVYTLHLEDIKSIVTKEQFESMEYKVNE